MAHITVVLDTDNPRDLGVLATLDFLGHKVDAPKATVAAPEAPAPKPAPEPEEPASEGDDAAALYKQAVDAATELVSQKDGPKKVRAVLTDLGVARVSELA